MEAHPPQAEDAESLRSQLRSLERFFLPLACVH